MKNSGLWIAAISLLSVSAFADPTPVKMIDFNFVGGSGGSMRIWETTSDAPITMQAIRFEGSVLGTPIEHTYAEADLTRLKQSRQPETVVKYRGLNAMDFLPAADFDIHTGGMIDVGYLSGPTHRVVAKVQMTWAPAEERWYLDYHPATSNEVYRLVSVRVIFKTEPIIGVVGVDSLAGTDDHGRVVTLQPGQ